MRAIRYAVCATGRAVVYRNNNGFDLERKVLYGLGRGSPDLVGYLFDSGRFLGLEVKRPGQKPSDEQRQWISVAARRGALVAVVTSVAEALALVYQETP
jgi:hypothetical protein